MIAETLHLTRIRTRGSAVQLNLSHRVLRAVSFCAIAIFLLSVPASLWSQEKLTDFSLLDGSGKALPLSSFKDKVLLIVNIASQSMYSDQIPALSKLQDEYKNQ